MRERELKPGEMLRELRVFGSLPMRERELKLPRLYGTRFGRRRSPCGSAN